MAQSTISQDLERFQNINQRIFGLLPSLSDRLSLVNRERGSYNHQLRTNNHHGQNVSPNQKTTAKRDTLFPKLVDEDNVLFSKSNRYRATPPSSSRSVELPPSKSRGRLRKRASSIDTLPSLPSQSLRTNVSLSTKPNSNEASNTTSRFRRIYHPANHESDSDTESVHGDDGIDDDNKPESPIVSIDPFPNVGVESFLQNSANEIMMKPRAPTPPRRKPKKQKKKNDAKLEAAKKQKARAKRAARKRQWKPPVTAAVMRRDQEVARRHPIRKQFLYSELIDEELKSYIPKRQPGGKLKPIYKRNNLGEIYIPDAPIEVAFEKLSSGNHEGETAASINRRRREELQAFLQRRKKLIGLQKKKRRKRVRFRLPKDHVPSDSAEDDTDTDSESDEEGHDHEVRENEHEHDEHEQKEDMIKMDTDDNDNAIESVTNEETVESTVTNGHIADGEIRDDTHTSVVQVNSDVLSTLDT